MKVYEYIKIDMQTGETLEEVSYEYEGPVALAFGNGNSGTIGFPAYMQDFHTTLLGAPTGLTVSVGTAYEDAVEGATPYDGETAYDPTTDLAANQNRYNDYNTLVTGLSSDVDWTGAVDTAVAKLDDGVSFPKIDLFGNDIGANAVTNALAAATAAMANANIAAAVDAHEARMTPRFLRSVQRFAGGMADINAVQSSAFVIGMALLENDILLDANKFDADLATEVFRAVAPAALQATVSAAATKQQQRNIIMADGVNRLMAAINEKIQHSQQATHLQGELNRVKIVAKGEQLARDVELDVHEAWWDLDTFVKATASLGAIGGGQPIPSKPGQLQSTLGGAIQGVAAGAAVGAAFGSAGGPIGAGIGLLLGGIIGATR